MPTAAAATAVPAGEAFKREALLAWYRGEFAAANAIIDGLCGHLEKIAGDGAAEYEALFAALHRRRMNWIPVLQMQRYIPITDFTAELHRLASSRAAEAAEFKKATPPPPPAAAAAADAAAVAVVEGEIGAALKDAAEEREIHEIKSSEGEEVESLEYSSGDTSDRKIDDEARASDGGSHAGRESLESLRICANHEDCAARPDRIKIMKGFVAKEPVKGHMVNVVKGLKVYHDIFTSSELSKLSDVINELRLAGRRGELSGETFIYFNKEMKGNKREIIQFGVPLFQPTNEEATNNIEPIPPLLQTIIDHLAQWRLIPESRMPNSCIINFFDEGEYSQPYFKPPHLDNPISTLLLSETTMAFGRMLVTDPNGNYNGSLTLEPKAGSLLVMRGNSADMARHVVCSSENKRVTITFVKVRQTETLAEMPFMPPLANAMTLWQPMSPPLQKVSGGPISYGPGMIPSWGIAVRPPVLMLAPPRPMAMSPGAKVASSNGTGVFLPWTVGPKKFTRHLPPRIQKRRFPSLLEAEAGKVSPIS